MKERDVEVGVIGQQLKHVITLASNENIKEGMQAIVEVGETSMVHVVTLAPNGNIEEGMQANVEVGETSTIAYVNRIEFELQRTIDMIKD
jgi:hypothetical protein